MTGSLAGKRVAYFSMEIGINSKWRTYAGGLGILAGDTLRAAADLNVPIIAISLVHKHGYLRQELSAAGAQIDHEEIWNPDEVLERLPHTVEIEVDGRALHIGAYKAEIRGVGGHVIQVIFLNTDLPNNSDDHRKLTDRLYSGDSAHRIRQELVLGIGGLKMLRALGYNQDLKYHLNEGHASFLMLGLLEENEPKVKSFEDNLNYLRSQCVFTTHTPVSAGHDSFSVDQLSSILNSKLMHTLQPFVEHETLNMTHIALRSAGFVNAVSSKHAEVTRKMFPDYEISFVTNGVHAGFWAADPIARLFDRHIPEWRSNSNNLKNASSIPLDEIWGTHLACKKALFDEIFNRTSIKLREDRMTIGFARRSTQYKRPLLLFKDFDRLNHIAQKHGGLQLIFAGKAHPADHVGKELVHQINELSKRSNDLLSIVFVANYEMELAHKICAGVDVWLNTPLLPLEASGTSGMKCALNGVPNLSVLDGWWCEGHSEDVTGWSITAGSGEINFSPEELEAKHAENLYTQLDTKVLETWYKNPTKYREIMRNAISVNGSFFNTHRMIEQYQVMAYNATVV